METWNQLFKRVQEIFEENELNQLPYHNWEHTLRVIEKSEWIAQKENIDASSIHLIRVAALYHDIGFIYGPFNHEENSVDFAEKDLNAFHFKRDEIDLISGMIRATAIPQNPHNTLEKIIADADLEYLGTDEYEAIAGNLYRELIQFSPHLSSEKWLEIQISFMNHHHYHTAYCLQHRKPKKEENLQELLSHQNP